jgi:serine-type D-Ala-D-Ala carboxypeptidase (penicillin-binding protein 5/6)
MAKKKNFLKDTEIILLTVGLFLITIPVLIFLPQVADFTQSKIASTSAKPGQNQTNQVAQEERKLQVEIQSNGINPPKFSAPAVIAEDFDSGQILYQKNIHNRMLPASTTKILTALVAIDYYKNADILTVPKEAMVGGSSMGLTPGEQLSFRSLLYGMLLNSGNDAAFTIASNYPGGLTNFMAQMNIKAQNLGLNDTHFQNPAGFDDPEQYSSAFDLAKIATAAASNPELAKVVATKETAVASVDEGRQFILRNLDQLLGIKGVIGFKTGTTPEAGENFVGLVERNNHKVLTVVLSSADRYSDTAALMDWTYQNYSWRTSYQ